MTQTNKMTNETQTKQFTCFNCGAKVDEAKRWYHADQDDMVCLACAEKLEHTDTAYSGTSVAKMEVETKTSQVNGLSSVEERLAWCEEYIKVLLGFKDESNQMHILDGNEVSEINQRLSKLEENN